MEEKRGLRERKSKFQDERMNKRTPSTIHFTVLARRHCFVPQLKRVFDLVGIDPHNILWSVSEKERERESRTSSSLVPRSLVLQCVWAGGGRCKGPQLSVALPAVVPGWVRTEVVGPVVGGRARPWFVDTLRCYCSATTPTRQTAV